MFSKLSVSECFEILQLRADQRKNFKKALIENVENHQGWFCDLRDFSHEQLGNFAIDFFISGDIERWWPSMQGKDRQSWMENDNVDRALETLLIHWREGRKKADRRNDRISHQSKKVNRSRSDSATKYPKSDHTKEHRRSNMGQLTAGTDHKVNDESIAVARNQGKRTAIRGSVNAPYIISSGSTSASILPDIPFNEDEQESELDDLIELPSPADLVRDRFAPTLLPRNVAIRTASPLPGSNRRIPEEDLDSTYRPTQTSTIEQIPVTPPSTKRKFIRRIIGDDDEPEETAESPSAKRARPHLREIGIEIGSTSSSTESKARLSDEVDGQIATILAEPGSSVAQSETVVSGVEQQQAQEATRTDDSTQNELQEQFDPFVELSQQLVAYLRSCKDNNLRRANAKDISEREAQKLQIRGGLLEHVYCDVVSRINAVNAKRRGSLEPTYVSSYVFNS